VSITIVHVEDWVGVYRDGKLLDQGHSFQEEQLLRVLGIEAESFWVEPADSAADALPPELSQLEEWGWKRS